MKKRKSLTKRIQRLKTRLSKDAKKLAKLTLKLGASVAGGKTAAKRKPAARPARARKPAKTSAPAKTSKGRSTRKAAQKPATPPPKTSSAPKAKKKLNLTPERRAQLAAAMKARWQAKRAGDARNPPGAQGASPGDGSQPS